MQGHFDAMVIDDLGMGDAPFLAAIDNQDIDGLLDRHPIAARASTPNQVFQPLVQQILAVIFGMPAVGTNGNGAAAVALSQLSTEPAYTDHTSTVYTDYDWFSSAGGDDWSHVASQFRRFWADRSEPTLIWTDPNREGYYYRDRFLWLPSNGVFTNIRSIVAYGSDNANNNNTANNYQYWRMSRTRLKDSGGNPITLQKSGSQGFLVEYTIKLFSR